MLPKPTDEYKKYLTRPVPDSFLNSSRNENKIVISLKRQEHKLNVFKQRYTTAGFSLDELTVLEGYDALRTNECPQPNLTLRQLDDLKRERYDHRFFNKTAGYGCYLSHAQAWKWIVDSNKPSFIFEDDAAFQMDKKSPVLFQKMIDKALRSMGNNQAQKEHLVLFLGYIEVPGHRRTFEKNKITDDKLGKPFAFKGIMHGLQGYYVTPGAAQTLLDYAFPIEMQVDSYIGILADVLDDFNKLTLVAFKKSLVNQANINDSNIQSKCTLCNGHVNANRFHTKSLMEKREICRRMGGCPMDFSSAAPSVKSSSSSVVGFVLTALAATSLLFLNKKK
jgi:GR25 family glycosyltransferase involved in LPS biosynthesis